MKKYEHRKSYELETSNWWFRGMQIAYEEIIQMYFAPGSVKKILDVGCGTGQILSILKKYGGSLYGVDISNVAIDFCKRRGFSDVFVSDATKLDFPENTFDLITAFMIIEHIDDDSNFLNEIHRLIKIGGKIIISTSAFNCLWSEHDEASEHKRRYTVKELRSRVNAAGFKIKKMSYFNFFLFLPFLLVVFIKNIFEKKNKKRQERILFNLPRVFTELLVLLMKLESLLLKYINFPYGINIICVLEKT